jgi:hypothetical protein
MRLSILSHTLAYGSLAAASQDLYPRDLATVSSVIATVDSNIKSLAVAVDSFQADATQINAASQALISSITQGTATISVTAELSLADALSLQQTITTLQTDAQALITALQSKKAAFETAGLCTTVLQVSTDLSAAGKGLIDTIIGKVPEGAREIARNLASGVSTVLGQGASLFSATSCRNGAAGAGGGSGVGVSLVPVGSISISATAIVESTLGAMPFPSYQAGGGSGGQGQCMCPCACAATTSTSTFRPSPPPSQITRPTQSPSRPPLPTQVTSTATVDVIGTVTPPATSRNVTTSRPSQVVTAGAAVTSGGFASLLIFVLFALLL